MQVIVMVMVGYYGSNVNGGDAHGLILLKVMQVTVMFLVRHY